MPIPRDYEPPTTLSLGAHYWDSTDMIECPKYRSAIRDRLDADADALTQTISRLLRRVRVDSGKTPEESA